MGLGTCMLFVVRLDSKIVGIMFSTVFSKQTFIMVFWLFKSDATKKVSKKLRAENSCWVI